MVNLQTVQAHNATLKSLAPGLVAVFVGGTSGIALSTAREFTRSTRSPHIYLVGRSQEAADSAISEFRSINPSAQTTFLKSDISLLKNVDSVCAEIRAKENKVNLLFMTPGYLTLKGRDETAEGLDRKFSLHYYARMRFVSNLLPLLSAAAKDPDQNARLSRVISVLDPHAAVRTGSSGVLDYSDLSLKNNFSLGKCGAHASIMMNFYLEHLAKRNPSTSFVHAFPGGVDTGVLREFGWIWNAVKPVMKILLSAVMVPVQESGERHLFAATSPKFGPKEQAEGKQDVAVGSDGVKGSGSYLASWDGEVFSPNKKLEQRRSEGALEKTVQHTEEVFRKICDEGGKYP